MTFNLTETQKTNYSAIQWLLGHGPQGSGRTTLMAHIFIERAIQNIGQWTHVFDHEVHRRSTHHLFQAIDGVFNSREDTKNYWLDFRPHESMIKVSYHPKLENPYVEERYQRDYFGV